MEQKPVQGADPLDPPSVDTARRFLESAEALQGRREIVLDRRVLARLHFINGTAFAIYFGLLMALVPAGSQAGSVAMLLILPFLAWMQLFQELRSSYGFLSRMSKTQGLLYALAVIIVMIVFFWQLGVSIAGEPVALGLLAVPSIVMFTVFALMGVRELKNAGPPRDVAYPRMPFTVTARILTLGMGVFLSALVVIADAGIENAVLVWGALAAGYLVLLVWMLTVQSGTRSPELGATWRWPQWLAFAVGCAVLTGAVVGSAYSWGDSSLMAWIGAAVVLLTFAIASLVGRRDE